MLFDWPPYHTPRLSHITKYRCHKQAFGIVDTSFQLQQREQKKKQVSAVAPFTNKAGGVVSVIDLGVETFPEASTMNIADPLLHIVRVPPDW